MSRYEVFSRQLYSHLQNGALMNYPWLFCPSDNSEHRLGLLMRSRALVHTFLYLYWLCDPRRCEINRKVRAPRRVSASGAPHIVTWIKQAWIKHQCTKVPISYKIVKSKNNLRFFSFCVLFAFNWFIGSEIFLHFRVALCKLLTYITYFLHICQQKFMNPREQF